MPKKHFIQWPWRSRAAIAREVDDELAFHLESRIAELVASGIGPREARAQATREFGDIEFTRTYCRRVDAESEQVMRMTDAFDEWRRDLRQAVRALRHRPAFAAICVLTLAIAIGANTAVFSVARSVLLAPLPYGHADSLFRLYDGSRTKPDERNPFAPANYEDYRTQQHSFEIAALNGLTMTVAPAKGDPEIVLGFLATPNTFDVLEARPFLGRGFASGEDKAGQDDKAILSYKLWKRLFGGDSSVVGKRMTVGGRSVLVIGVMPAGFGLGWDEELWMPLDLTDDLSRPVTARRQHYLQIIARLKTGQSIDAARTELTTIAKRLEAQYPESNNGRTVTAVPLREVMTGKVRTPLLLLQGAALIVLLIACANLANLTLSRAMGRRREMAVRAALGAGRSRIIRQTLVESILLSVVGGACGIAVAVVATRTLLALNAATLPTMFGATIDAGVLWASLAASTLSGAIVGLLPAIDAARVDLNESLKSGGRSVSGSRGGERTRRVLVVAQIGLAVMLLVAAGLLVRSFDALTTMRLGYDPDHVLTAQVRASGSKYDTPEGINRFFDGVLRELAAAPEVTAAGSITYLPTQGSIGTTIRIIGSPIDERNLPEIGYASIRDDFLKAMRIPIIAGRGYDRSDLANGEKTVLINESGAKHFFPNGDAVGRRIVIGPNANGKPMTIIGVVGDVRSEGLDIPPRPMLIANHRQESWERTVSLVIRTNGDPMRLAPTLRRIVKAADPMVGVRDIEPFEDVLGTSLAPRRFALALASSFAMIALLLATVGIYGVLSYAVETRNRELGVRLALGASARSVLLLVLRQAATWALVGLAIGIAGALAAGRLLTGALYGVTSTDATTYAAVSLGLIVVVVAACVIPARRAMRVDPMMTMRAD